MLKDYFLFSQPSQDLSPIYEEIHGGSRSTVSSGSGGSAGSGGTGSSNSSGVGHAPHARGKFFYSEYAFTATDSTMLSITRGQVVRVIQVRGNQSQVITCCVDAFQIKNSI